MKKLVSLLIVFAFALSACGEAAGEPPEANGNPNPDDSTTSTTTTTTPLLMYTDREVSSTSIIQMRSTRLQ